MPQWVCPQPDKISREEYAVYLNNRYNRHNQGKSSKLPCKDFELSEIALLFEGKRANLSKSAPEEEKKQLDEWISEISGLLLKHYIINDSNVRTCPNSACGYAGSVDIDEFTGRIECVTPLQCLKCETTWMDPLQEYTSGASWKRSLGRLSRFYETFANNLRKILVASPCPNCGVMVSKNGGCPHMKCAKC